MSKLELNEPKKKLYKISTPHKVHKQCNFVYLVVETSARHRYTSSKKSTVHDSYKQTDPDIFRTASLQEMSSKEDSSLGSPVELTPPVDVQRPSFSDNALLSRLSRMSHTLTAYRNTEETTLSLDLLDELISLLDKSYTTINHLSFQTSVDSSEISSSKHLFSGVNDSSQGFIFPQDIPVYSPVDEVDSPSMGTVEGEYLHQYAGGSRNRSFESITSPPVEPHFSTSNPITPVSNIIRSPATPKNPGFKTSSKRKLRKLPQKSLVQDNLKFVKS